MIFFCVSHIKGSMAKITVSHKFSFQLLDNFLRQKKITKRLLQMDLMIKWMRTHAEMKIDK